MALISVGSIKDFSVEPTPEAPGAITEVDTFGALAEVSTETPANTYRFRESATPRGLAVASIRLESGFQSFLARLFHRTSDVYFVAWCWDLSGEPISLYPPTGAGVDKCLIPMRGGDVREFMGAGTVLFPARRVTAGIGARVQVWESKQGTRDFGSSMAAVSEQIQQSELNSWLTLIGSMVDPTAATIALIEEAALKLGKVIGTALKAASDDYVDFYEGYFPASAPWTAGKETYKGIDSELELSRFT
ncbi:hypothetical protein [Streptomyces sp. TRM68367]|uniref:hypothetical protein n=1 Tax=Streptomyces sp. TRM68367 TaxID=2758415 RepID=UPI00165B5674|nr:hypothetical protein [Streptomyces sp. TRM68367]MBC9729674.1 hypothetical protein [Streptomyces sp. TRM68367]